MSPLESTRSASGPPRGSRAPRSAAETATPPPELHEEHLQPGTPPALASTPSLGALFAALQRRWLLALVVTLIGAGLAAAGLAYLVPPQYVSEARILLRRPPDYMPGAVEGTFDDFMRAQALFVKSSRVLDETFQDPRVAQMPIVQANGTDRTWLTRDLIVKMSAGENVLPLKMYASDAADASAFLSALISAYRNQLRVERANQLSRLKGIEEKEAAELLELSKKLPTGDAVQLQQYHHTLSNIHAELRLAMTDLQTAEATVVAVDEQSVTDALDEEMRNDRMALELQTDMQLLRKQMNDISGTSARGDADPMLAPLRSRYIRLQQDEAALRASKRDGVKARLQRTVTVVRKTRIDELQAKIRRLEAQKQFYTQELKRLEVGPDPELRNLDARRKVVENIRSQRLTTIHRIEQDITRDEEAMARGGEAIPWVERLSGPTTPILPDRSQQIKAVGAGTIMVAGVLLFGVAFWEFRNRRATSADQISQGLGIATVGALPSVPAKAQKAALSAASAREPSWQGQLTESADALRTFLLRALGEGPHVVLVSSAVAGEGKTSVAGQLAASMARAWRKTLLIDGDLRKPAAHQLFDLPVEPGFSEVLRGEQELPDVIKATAVPRLCLMSAGQWDPHAQQALAQEGVGSLFEQLKEEYDLIVIDSSPVLPVADTLLLGQHVDTVILSVLKGTSRLPNIYAARQRLAALDIPVLGAVFVGGSNSVGSLDIQYPHPATQ